MKRRGFYDKANSKTKNKFFIKSSGLFLSIFIVLFVISILAGTFLGFSLKLSQNGMTGKGILEIFDFLKLNQQPTNNQIILGAGGATYYVATNGSDSNNGSINFPFRTIQHAADIVNPGDTVIVRNGTYTIDNQIEFRRSGTADNYITFKAEHKWGAIIDGHDTADYCLVFHDYLGNYTIVEGLEIKNCTNVGIKIWASHDIIRQNKIHHIGRRIQTTVAIGIHATSIGPYAQIDGNLIYSIGKMNPSTDPPGPPCDPWFYCYNHDHGIYVEGSYFNITNNIFYDMKSGWDVQICEGIQEHIIVEGNTFSDPNPYRDGQIVICGYSNESYTNDVLIKGNIFYNPTYSMIVSDCDWMTNIVIKDNLGNIGHVLSLDECDNLSGYTIANNTLNTDPLFVNATARNYHLQAGSPAINNITSSNLTLDFDGVSRPQGSSYDIGAYEYIGSNDNPPTAYQGTNPINGYNSTSSNITFDMKCSDDIFVSTIQLWTDTAGTWKANYSNSTYQNNTWLNISLNITNGINYKWAVYCNDSDGNSNITSNRTFSVYKGAWFVSNNSIGGDGTIENPWDLPTAFKDNTNPGNKNYVVKPGDTIYLREGEYHGEGTNHESFWSYLNGSKENLITIMPYNNEKVILDGKVNVYRDYVMFRDFEVIRDYVYNTNNSRVASDDNGNGIVLTGGFNIYGREVKIINNIIHDTSTTAIYIRAPNVEIYGNIVYNNGWDAPVMGHGHGTYIQSYFNETDFILNNIYFNNFGVGIHAYGEAYSEGEWVNDVYLENNTVFKDSFLVGAKVLNNITVIGNIFNDIEETGSAAMWLGYFNFPDHNNSIVKNNMIYGNLLLQSWNNLTLDNNTVVGRIPSYYRSSVSLNNENNISTLKINNNHYFVYAPELHYNYYSNGSLITNNFTVWQSLGYDVNGTYNSSNKTGINIYLRNNKYDLNRTDIIVFNWDNSDFVDVDLSGRVSVGAGYEVRDVQNYPLVIISGTYNGSLIRFPLNLTNYSKYAGNFTGEYHNHSALEVHTSKTFNTFILKITSGGGLVDNPPTITLNSPSNSYSTNLTSITFNCSANDDKRIQNISLYTNISSWQSINSTSCSGTSCTLVYTKTSIPIGAYKWNCLAYDNASQSSWASSNYTFTIINNTDSIAPTYSNLITSPSSPVVYALRTYYFNATWTDNVAVSNVILQFNATNYSYLSGQLTKSGNVYYKTFSNLSSGIYAYRWYANDTSNNWNSTSSYNYNITQANNVLALSSSAGWTLTYGTSTTLSCSSTYGTPNLYRNDTSISNPSTLTLGASTYAIKCNISSSQNYSSNTTQQALTVNKGTVTLSLSASPAWSVQYPSQTNITGTGCLSGLTCNLYINNSLVSNPDIQTNLSVGNYTYIYNTSGNANYSSASATNTLRVSSLPPDNYPEVNLISPNNGNSTNETSITFTCNATDDKKVQNLSLYHNASGIFSRNYTNTSCSSTTCYLIQTLTLQTDKTYKWNCLAYDNASQSSWAQQNFTLNIVQQDVIQDCSDGTLYGQCSSTKPLYCDTGNLVNKCSSCGCSSGTCQSDESCRTSDNSGGGGGATCASGQKQCSGNILQLCISSSWQTNQTCLNGCNSTTLMCNVINSNNQSNNNTNGTITCNDDEKKCSDDGKSLLTCSNNAWNSESCEKGCDSGSKECIEKLEAKDKINSFIAIVAGIIITGLIILFLSMPKILRKKEIQEGLKEDSN